MGGKATTREIGTHVPLIVYWPELIQAGSVNNDLIGFIDFLPTLADIANIPLPSNYGPLDGVSFAPRLIGEEGTPRDWLFYHYDSHPDQTKLKRWAQTVSYKLYDTSSTNSTLLFYNIGSDVNEKQPIEDASLTPQEIVIKQQLLDVINNYVAQGTAIISLDPSLSLVTSSSVFLKDTIRTNGGTTVTASGAVWSTSPNPEISSTSHTTTGVIWGPFSSSVKGLTPNTTYYIRAYATNYAGTAYSNQVIFKTLQAPIATSATAIDSIKLTANWNTFSGATAYRLDVSPSATFTKMNNATLKEGFNGGLTAPAGWSISNNIVVNTSAFGAVSPSLEFIASGAQVVTKKLPGTAKQLKFWFKGLNTNNNSSLLIEGFDGGSWTESAKIKNPIKTVLPKHIVQHPISLWHKFLFNFDLLILKAPVHLL